MGQFYVAILMVRLFPGKFWESIMNVSLKEDNQKIGAPPDAEGPLTKSGAPRVLKKFIQNFFFFSYFSLSV